MVFFKIISDINIQIHTILGVVETTLAYPWRGWAMVIEVDVNF